MDPKGIAWLGPTETDEAENVAIAIYRARRTDADRVDPAGGAPQGSPGDEPERPRSSVAVPVLLLAVSAGLMAVWVAAVVAVRIAAGGSPW